MQKYEVVQTGNSPLHLSNLQLLEADEDSKPIQDKQIPSSKLFSFETSSDRILLILGSISSIIEGAISLVFCLMVGKMFDINKGWEWKDDSVFQMLIGSSDKILYIAGVYFIASYCSVFCWRVFGESQAARIRKGYLKTLLSQGMAQLEAVSRIDDECFKIQDGLGGKLSSILLYLSRAAVGIIIGLSQNWKLTLILIIPIPFFLFVYIQICNVVEKSRKAKETAYAQAGNFAKEALNKIKLVTTLGGQHEEKMRYEAALEAAEKKEEISDLILLFVRGSYAPALFAIFAVGLCVGSLFIVPLTMSVGKIFIVVSCVLIAGFCLVLAFEALKAFTLAKSTWMKMSRMIETGDDKRGAQLSYFEGDIEFSNVRFENPNKAGLLDSVSLKIRKNQRTALVGDDTRACVVDLLQRFNDDFEGSITLDGHKIEDLNRRWLRENLGYIGKEHALFEENSIRENLLMATKDVEEGNLWDALEKVKAYQFIKELPKGLDSEVKKLSEGQKYLVGLARVILKDPKILIIEEGFSGDMKDEIEKALDEVSRWRTVIVIAKKLSTMKKADHIFVLEKGKVVEEGKHQDLIENQVRYSNLLLQFAELSTSTMKIEKAQNGASKNKVHAKVAFKLFDRYFKESWDDISIGIFLEVLNGIILIAMSYFIAEMFSILYLRGAGVINETIISPFMIVLILVLFYWGLKFAKSFILNSVGKKMTKKIRNQLFDKFLKQPVAWHELPEHNAEALSSQLSKVADMVKNVVVPYISSHTLDMPIGMFQALGLAIGVVLLSKITSKEKEVNLFALLAAVAWICDLVRSMAYAYFYPSIKTNLYQDSSNFRGKIVKNVKTAISFKNQNILQETYRKKLEKANDTLIEDGLGAGILSSLGGFSSFCIWGLLMPYLLIDINEAFKWIFHSLSCALFVYFGAWDISFPESGLAAAYNILNLLDTETDQGGKNMQTEIRGRIEFLNVSFQYPNTEKPIFENLSFTIEAFTKVAIAGLSEDGRSAIMGLLQRFYDPSQGDIILDGVNIKDYDLNYLRNHFGVLTKEPVLFNNTIEYNIKYGKKDASEEEIRNAAQRAGALKFIENNEFEFMGENDRDGFKTLIDSGSKQSELSTSQKQKIAIVRSIIKNPTIMVLDDVRNEEILDQIIAGNTSIILSNKISVLGGTEDILVFSQGRLVERGSYENLKAQQGVIFGLEKDLILNL